MAGSLKKKHSETGALCFVNLKATLKSSKNVFMFLSISELLTSFSMKSNSTSLHVVSPFAHLNFCSFLLFADSHLSFQSLE